MDFCLPTEKMKCVLAIGAHPHDIAAGCGGSLVRLAETGVLVVALVLTRGVDDATDPTHGQSTCRALQALGVMQVVQLDFVDSQLWAVVPQMATAIEHTCGQFMPDRVYTMFQDDRDRDHQAAFEATRLGCRQVPQVFCYETLSAWPNFVPQVFQDITSTSERKFQALALQAGHGSAAPRLADKLRSLASLRGQQIGAAASEGFIPHRLVL